MMPVIGSAAAGTRSGQNAIRVIGGLTEEIGERFLKKGVKETAEQVGERALKEVVEEFSDDGLRKLDLQLHANKGMSEGWKVGNPINTLTKKGNYPSWSTSKSRY